MSTMDSLKDLTKQEFEIGIAKFKINKVQPFEAYRVQEIIRPGLAPVMDALASRAEEARGGRISNALITEAVSALITKLPPDVLEDARAALFTKVFFKNDVTHDWTPLGGREDEGFKGVHPLLIYEVIFRVIMVNFFDSWDDVQSRLEGLPIFDRSNTKTSQPSSPTP